MLRPEETILKKMRAMGMTLSTAESCTSGRIASKLTCVSGASDYFQGGLVAYQDIVKERFLGVPEDMIHQYDVVSRPVVEQMVLGACAMFGTDYAIASTGYAGDGCNGIASGTIWIAWGAADDVHSMCLTDDDGRELNTERAANMAIAKFAEYLG